MNEISLTIGHILKDVMLRGFKDGVAEQEMLNEIDWAYITAREEWEAEKRRIEEGH